jgi:Di-haem oxidoreductase, putative peroxidase
MTTGCATCHIPRLTDHARSQGVAPVPFTELLLHDMGTALADGLEDEGINGGEVRTPPLRGSAKPDHPLCMMAARRRSTVRSGFTMAKGGPRLGATNG